MTTPDHSTGGVRARIDFPDWVRQLEAIAAKDDVIIDTADTGTDCWWDYYNDGYSPADAWGEECSYD